MKKVLMVVFDFPPETGSSGLLRSLKFVRYLPQYGWLPIVLTPHNRAYERLDEAQLREIPPEAMVLKSFAFDMQRHLSIGGRYLGWLALPDRWGSWCLGAVPEGLRAIREHQIDVIYSTFPIATAVLIALVLHRRTGKPWVADMRDPMTKKDYPRAVLKRGIYRWIEKNAFRYATRFVFNAPSTRRLYRERYAWLREENCVVIPNGYDEDDFAGLDLLRTGPPVAGRPLRLLHMGVLYPVERDPRPFFRVLARLKKEGRVDGRSVRVDLQASGYDAEHKTAVRELGIEDLVHFLTPLPYHQALEGATTADGLLLFQGSACDAQIPVKAYEYLRLRRPILALTTPTSDTGALLSESGGATIVDLADESAIHDALPRFLASLHNGSYPLPDLAAVSRYGRKEQAAELARCLSDVCP